MLLGVLLAIVIIVCIALVGVILLQRSEGGALGMSGGGPGAFMTARGTGDLLSRTTQILAAIFFLLCLAMTLLSGHNRSSQSVVDQLKIKGINPNQVNSQAASSAPASTSAAAGAAPQQPQQRPSGAPKGPVGLFGEPLAAVPSPPKPQAQPQQHAQPAAPAAPSNPLANFIQQTPLPSAPAPATAPTTSGH